MKPAPATPPSLATSLRTVHVGLREDLEVSRHVFRGEPCYIVRDPITLQSQRLALPEYGLFVSLNADRSLGESFAELVAHERLKAEDEERFFEFVVRLHRLGFLQLPIADDKALYRRYQLRERAKRREKLMGFLFLRIPLWNPNAFLDRTVDRARFLFSGWFFALWVGLMVAAGVVAVSRWGELIQPVHGVLVTRNLLLLWTTLVVLKFFHEMGHAYACKHYGGHVPELGAYLILFTPCAYMDATAAWGFPRKRHRIIVSLAGMYVESVLAALALFVWATTESSLINALAYNVLFLAGVVTVLFNINPLMRYDGYYILSDWLEIPNLRQRAQQHVLQVLKRWFLGLEPALRPLSRRLRWILFAFGVGAAVYRVILLLALASILASSFLFVGLVVGVGYVAVALGGSFRKLVRYLWWSTETATVRRRAVALSVLLFALLPATALWVPLPSRVYAAGVVAGEHESVIRAKRGGFLESASVQGGQRVEPGDLLALLSNDVGWEEVARARAHVRATEIRRDAFRGVQPTRAAQQDREALVHAAALAKAEKDVDDLRVHAPDEGCVVFSVQDRDVGTFLPAGAPIASIVAGAWQARSILPETQLVRSHAKVGDTAQFRSAGDATRTVAGRIVRIAPAGARTIEFPSLTHVGGGDIPVEPTTGTAAQPYFEVVVELSPAESDELRSGMTGCVRFGAPAEPLAAALFRSALRFWNRVMQQ